MIHSSRISLEEFIKKSKYKVDIVRNLIRSTISTLFNNPTKAMIFLCTDFTPLTPEQIRLKTFKEVFGCSSKDSDRMIKELATENIKSIGSKTVSSYFDDCILKYSFFIKREKVNQEDNSKIEKGIYKYYKTLDGSVIGDFIALKCIESSSDPNYCFSNYSIYSSAATTSEIDAQMSIILLLLYLYKEKIFNKPKPMHDIIDDIYEFKGSRNSLEYHRLKKRIKCRLDFMISKLGENCPIEYNSIKTTKGECILYSALTNDLENILDEKNIQKLLEMGYSESSIHRYKSYAKKVLRYIIYHPRCSSKKISKATNLSIKDVYSTSSMLRKLGFIKIDKGKPREEFATLRLKEEGKYHIERYLIPILNLLGMNNLIEDPRISNLNLFATPDLVLIYRLRKEIIDSIIEDRVENLSFIDMCKNARKRHQEESNNIKIYNYK